MSLISLLVALIVISLVFWVIRTLAPTLGLPEPIVKVIYVVAVVIVVLWLLQLLTGTTFVRL